MGAWTSATDGGGKEPPLRNEGVFVTDDAGRELPMHKEGTVKERLTAQMLNGTSIAVDLAAGTPVQEARVLVALAMDVVPCSVELIQDDMKLEIGTTLGSGPVLVVRVDPVQQGAYEGTMKWTLFESSNGRCDGGVLTHITREVGFRFEVDAESVVANGAHGILRPKGDELMVSFPSPVVWDERRDKDPEGPLDMFCDAPRPHFSVEGCTLTYNKDAKTISGTWLGMKEDADVEFWDRKLAEEFTATYIAAEGQD